ncbi:MAG: hypothetical protein PHC75_08190 [Burkholderiales bacterium]|nr:hypothetical protein [Burkholderiales bacterium]
MLYSNDQLDEEYRNHKLFLRLDQYINFYNQLSGSIVHFVTIGTTSIINLDTYVCSSLSTTLESIKVLLWDGKINDAFTLLRKYYDSSIINIYTNLYLSENFTLENLVVKQINDWLHGKQKIPEYRAMSEYIKNSQKLLSITKLLSVDDRYKKVRKLCNDHTHWNFFKNLLTNDKNIYLKDRVVHLNNFNFCLQELFIQHTAYLFYLNNHYMLSSDYMDYIDCGTTPPDEAQYWVAPFIQDMFDKEIKTHRNDIFNEIKNNTQMQLN